MIVFINSICNLTCEHCFYWKELNKRNDLTYEEFENLRPFQRTARRFDCRLFPVRLLAAVFVNFDCCFAGADTFSQPPNLSVFCR